MLVLISLPIQFDLSPGSLQAVECALNGNPGDCEHIRPIHGPEGGASGNSPRLLSRT
jgi:hypothetical protein